MKVFRTKTEDATFELNLAPMLDIIVSIVPMLLLSVAFVHVTVIDTPIPQVVEKAIAAANEKNKDLIQVSLRISKKTGFIFTVSEHGKSKEFPVALSGEKFDLAALHRETLAIKKIYPDVFRLELNPDESIPLDEIVTTLDQVRTTTKNEPKVTFKDEAGKAIETNLLFPDVTFANVTGGT